MTGLEIPIALATALFTAAGVAATGVGSAATAGTLGYRVHQDRKKKKYSQQQVHQALTDPNYPVGAPQQMMEHVSVYHATSGGGRVHFGADGSMSAGGSRPGDVSWGYTTIQRTNGPPFGYQPNYHTPPPLPVRPPIPIGTPTPTSTGHPPAFLPQQMPYGLQIPFQPITYPVVGDAMPPPYSAEDASRKKLKKHKSFWR